MCFTVKNNYDADCHDLIIIWIIKPTCNKHIRHIAVHVKGFSAVITLEYSNLHCILKPSMSNKAYFYKITKTATTTKKT